MMTYLVEFKAENDFLALLARNKVQTHFPLETPVANFP